MTILNPPPLMFPAKARRRLALTISLAITGTLVACNSGSGTPEQNSASAASVKLVQGGDNALLETYLKEGLRRSSGVPLIMTVDGSTQADDSAAPESGSGSKSGERYSETNTQVTGVDEADLVKYDGEHIYIAANQQIYTIWDTPTDKETTEIIEDEAFAPTPGPQTISSVRIMRTTQGEKPDAQEVNRIELSDNQYIEGLYLYQGNNQKHLAVVGTDNNYGWSSWLRYDLWGSSSVAVSAYDVTHPENATASWSIKLEGALIDSRRIGNMLYLVTRYVPNLPELNWYAYDEESIRANNELIDKIPVEALMPTYTRSQQTSTPLVDPSQCYVPETEREANYAPALITVSAIDLTNPDSIKSTCVAGYTSGIYSSTEALYVFNDQWSANTAVHKFSYTGQETEYKGSGVIPGTLGWRAPSFRLNEKEGALFAVSTELPESSGWIEPALMEDTPVKGEPTPVPESTQVPIHRLTVLKENGNGDLIQIAQIPNASEPEQIGKPGEDIYAVRYQGDRAYVVTYLKTDPLYVIDIKTPSSPSIAGELHVEGFSDYLHPVGNYLIGIGKSAQIAEDTAWYQGVQVGLFDVENLSAPSLISQFSIGQRGTDTDVSFTHKAFSMLALDDDHYRIAFPVRLHTGPQKHPSDYTEWKHSGLYLYDLNLSDAKPSFQGAGEIIAETADSPGDFPDWVEVQRGILHEDSVYYVYGENVISAPWQNPDDTEKQ